MTVKRQFIDYLIDRIDNFTQGMDFIKFPADTAIDSRLRAGS
jgi:hypothetical protein